jgi:small GTP-binding protein
MAETALAGPVPILICTAGLRHRDGGTWEYRVPWGAHKDPRRRLHVGLHVLEAHWLMERLRSEGLLAWLGPLLPSTTCEQLGIPDTPPGIYIMGSVRDTLSQLEVPVADVAQAACAAQHWRKVAMSDALWDFLLQRDYLERGAPSYVQYKELNPRLHRCSARQHDVLLKLMMVGDGGVGKSSFLLRLSDSTFHDRYISTIGVDFKHIHTQHQGLVVKLQVWDTSGPERFRTISASYWRRADGLFLMYDQASRASFGRVSDWHAQLERHAPEGVQVVRCANKRDLQPEVTAAEGRAMAARFGWAFGQASSRAVVAPLRGRQGAADGPAAATGCLAAPSARRRIC